MEKFNNAKCGNNEIGLDRCRQHVNLFTFDAPFIELSDHEMQLIHLEYFSAIFPLRFLELKIYYYETLKT